MPAIDSTHIPIFLTSISVAYHNDEYVGDRVFQFSFSDKLANKFIIYSKEFALRATGVDAQGNPKSVRKPGSESLIQDYTVSNQAFYCEMLARKYRLLDMNAREADDPLQPMVDGTINVTETIHLDAELAVAAIAQKRANYASSNKAQLVTGTTSWLVNTLTGGNPTSWPIQTDIPNAKRAVMLGSQTPATHILMNYATQEALQANWEYKKYIQYTSRDGLTKGGIVPILLGLETIEANQQYLTSAENVTPYVSGYIWTDDQGEDTALVFTGKNPNMLRQPSFGATFIGPDATFGMDKQGGDGSFLVKVWREERFDATMIEARTTRAWAFTTTDGSTNGYNSNGYATGGYLISGTTL